MSSKLDELILKMLKDGDEFCRHPNSALVTHHSQGTPRSQIHVMCAHCALGKTVKAEDWKDAIKVFLDSEEEKIVRFHELKEFWDMCIQCGWKPEYIPNLLKGQPMSTEDYKRGVLDATEPFPDVYGPIVTYRTDAINQALTDRRKKLLTKKVTKWVAVGISPSNGKPYAQGYFQDSKESALANKTGDPGDPTFIGVFPIEIEVEI